METVKETVRDKSRQVKKELHEVKQEWKEVRREKADGALTRRQLRGREIELIAKFIEGSTFSFVVACAILLNVLVMWIQVDSRSLWPAFWSCLNTFLWLFFSLEIVLRLVVHRPWGFFCEAEDRAWNTFDFVVVALSWTIAVGGVVERKRHGSQTGLKLLRTVRMLRILRVLRIFKIPVLRKLNTIVSGLISAFSTVMWIAVLLFVVMYVSAILCTNFIGHEADQWEDPDDFKEIVADFGSMSKSFATLFQFLTLADWSEIVRVVSKRQLWMAFFLVIYICFAAFVILSLLTGVVADHVNEVREQQEEDERAEAKLQFRAVLNAEFHAFREMQCSGQTRIDREHFRDMLEKNDLRRELKACKVDLEDFDVNELFDSFNSKSDGLLSWPDFEKGMQELRRGVEAKEIFKLEVSLQRAVDTFEGKPRVHHSGIYDQAEKERSLETAQDTAKDMLNQFDSLIASMDEYIDEAEGCISGVSVSDE